MRRLPSLTAGSYRWQLPLPPGLGHRLLFALLQPDSVRRSAALLACLQQAVPLALWTVCRAYERCGVELNDMAQLAAWLDEHAEDELQWTPGEWEEVSENGIEEPTDPSPAPPADLPDGERYRHDWLARGVSVAERAVESLRREESDSRAENRVYLVGLLHQAGTWLDACRTAAEPKVAVAREQRPCDPGSQHGSQQPHPSCLPPNLAKVLRQLASPPGPGDGGREEPLLRHVRNAIETARESCQSPIGGPPTDNGSVERRVATASLRDAERHSHTVTGDDLPGLLRRVAELTRIERQFHVALEEQKLAAIKELAYGASHEINNPLANISTRAQTLLRDETDPERRRKLATINSQAFRAHEMISDLMLFAHPPQPVLQTVDLADVARQVVDAMREDAERQQTELIGHGLDVSLPLRADAALLAAAIQALCRNALEALSSGGRIDVRIVAQHSKPSATALRPAEPFPSGPRAGWGCVEVRDNGPGMPDEVRRHAFEPYYSGREAGRGLGLGLSKCWRIVTLHGGQVQVESEPGHGSVFRLWLPVMQAPRETDEPAGGTSTAGPSTLAGTPAEQESGQARGS